jgi:plastocyanin
VGVDFTTNSEIVFTRLGGNEAQFWLGAPVYRSPRAALEALVAHNTAAGGLDGALTGRLRTGRLAALAEARGFTNVLGTGEGGAAWAIGGVVHLTPLLELSGDVGRLFGHDSLSSVWSVGVALGIPGTPHTLALQVTNGGAMTLQGTSRPKVLGPESVRYGFVFTAPLGSASQWARIFRKNGGETRDTTATVTVTMRQIALDRGEVRIRVGESVAWVNRDPLVHTVTADDGSWDSGPMVEGARWTRTFDRPGRYAYHCTPHPQMRGVIIVEP